MQAAQHLMRIVKVLEHVRTHDAVDTLASLLGFGFTVGHAHHLARPSRLDGRAEHAAAAAHIKQGTRARRDALENRLIDRLVDHFGTCLGGVRWRVATRRRKPALRIRA
jgi:hypothetical protein